MTTDDKKSSNRKHRTGVVIKDAMDKTVVVMVETRTRHPVYGKILRQHKKLYVHDEKNEAKVGDTIRVEETRPLSRMKRWRLLDFVSRAEVQEMAGTR
jgi:small subunit ribosomal protein S17